MQSPQLLTKVPEKASLSTILSYAVGFAPSAVLCYNAFYLYYMYFMTDVVNISAMAAGWISMIAIAWDAISDPIIAFRSDKCRWKSGRRVPFMTIGVVVMSAAFVAIFSAIDASETVKVIYFVCATIIFWTGATMWDIPHNALGSELVSKQSERERLRVGTSIVDALGVLFIVLIIPNLSSLLTEKVGNEPRAWQLTMLLIACLALIVGLTVCSVLKNREPKIDWTRYDEEHRDEKKEKIGTTIREIFRLKPYKFLCAAVVLANTGNVCVQSAIVYFMTHLCGFNPAQQSLVLGVNLAAHLVFGFAVGGGLQKKFGSRKLFITGLTISMLASIVFPNFCNTSNVPLMCIYSALMAIGARVLWLYCYIYAYGIAMLDNIKNHKYREANIVGFMSLGLKTGSAIATWLIGFVLSKTGYDGELPVQSAAALQGIRSILGILPVIFLGIGLLLIIKYPMRDRDMAAIETAIKQRDTGLEYSTEKFKHLF